MKMTPWAPSRSTRRLFIGPCTPVSMTCLDELRRQQVINEKVYDQNLMDDPVRKLAWEGVQKNMVMDGDTMIDRRTGEVLGHEVDFTY